MTGVQIGQNTDRHTNIGCETDRCANIEIFQSKCTSKPYIKMG